METQYSVGKSFSEEDVRTALRAVIDPEIGMNIVDLGLVYRVAVLETSLAIDMTLTSPACPMGEMLIEDVERALRKVLPEGMTLDLQLVWEPPWSPELMSEKAREQLGWEE